MIDAILSSFDLSAKEIKVVKKLIEFGTQPASQIARLTEIPRNTSRDILDKLTKRGLLIRTERANAWYYGVDNLKNMIFHLQRGRVSTNDKYDRQIDLLKKFGDCLIPHTQRGNRPRITFYDGVEGLERVYEDTLTSRTEILAYASLEEMYSALKDYFPAYFARRAKKKIHIKAIFPDSEFARERQKHNKEELRESVVIPRKGYDITPEINIYDGKIIFISWKEKIAIQIQSKEIYESMKFIFELSWAEAKRRNTLLVKSKK